MIEIIVREDFNKYEVKPIFGHSLREWAVVAACVLLSFGIYFGLSQVGVHIVIIGLLICAVSGLLGIALLKKFDGMYLSKRLPILLNYYKRPEIKFIRSPYFVFGEDLKKNKNKPKMTRKEKRDLKRELKKAKKETERIESNA